MANELELQNFLTAVTDALLADNQAEMNTIIAGYSGPRGEVEGLVGLIRRLHTVLVGQAPSQRFVRRLKHDLVGAHGRNLVAHVRYLPPRVQIAAFIALVITFMFITRRRLLEESRREKAELALQAES
jgi:hypothetical protein